MIDPRQGLFGSAGRKAGALGRSAPKLIAALLAIAAMAVAATGCGSDDPSPAATSAAELPTGEDSHAVEAEYDQPPRPAQARIGETIVLDGINIGVRLRVVATRVLDPAPGAGKPAGDGRRWVAVELRAESTGIAIFESEIRSAALSYGAGASAKPVRTVTARCSNGFDAVVRLDVGDRTKGCVLFRVPDGAEPELFQLALESRPVQEGGKWSLGSSDQSP